MIKFSSQKPYEKTALYLRRHWLILFFIYFSSAFLAIVGLISFYLAKRFFLLQGNELALSQFLLAIYFLMIWHFLFRSLTDYYLDAWFVTDHRILEIHQIDLFKRDISELRLSKIQDVNVKIKGILPTFFNYGDVVIQTAGAIPEFRFEQVPRPQKVKNEILRLHDEFVKNHPDDHEVHEL